MIVPMEKVLRSYLNTLNLGVKVVGETPKDINTGWVKITSLDDRAIGNAEVDYFHNHHVQLDCYASVDGTAGQDEAREIYLTVREALVGMKDAEHDGATVTACRFGACPRIPDEAFKPSRQRFIIDAHIYAHTASVPS